MTIKEIAQLAGVSSAAVSRYLNGDSYQKGKPGGRGRPEDQFRIHQPDHSRH